VKGLPIELILILLFGVAMLFNFVKQRADRKQRAEAAKNEPEREEEIPEEIWRALSAAELPPTATDRSTRRRAEAPTVLPDRPRRRFARQTLLGNRRKVQDAFVVATILGRCRCDEPHEIS